MLASAAAFSAMGFCIQVLAPELSNAMVVFFRNAAGLIVILAIALRRYGAREAFATRHLFEHGVRGFAGLASMYCFFYAIANLRLADALLLQYTMPLFIPFIEAVWLGEPLTARLAVPLGLGFLGVVIVLNPGSSVFAPAAFVGLAAGALSAVAQTGIRRLTRTEPTVRIILYFATIATAASALALPFAWVTPSPRSWAIIAAMGLFATVGQVFLTKAYSYAPASQIGGFVYAGVLFGAFVDWFRLGALPAPSFFAGAALVIVAGWLMFRVARDHAAVLEHD